MIQTKLSSVLLSKIVLPVYHYVKNSSNQFRTMGKQLATINPSGGTMASS